MGYCKAATAEWVSLYLHLLLKVKNETCLISLKKPGEVGVHKVHTSKLFSSIAIWHCEIAKHQIYWLHKSIFSISWLSIQLRMYQRLYCFQFSFNVVYYLQILMLSLILNCEIVIMENVCKYYIILYYMRAWILLLCFKEGKKPREGVQ